MAVAGLPLLGAAVYLEPWAISWGLWCILSLACAIALTGWRLIRLLSVNAIAIACTHPFLGVDASSQDLLLNKRSTQERIVGGDMGVWMLACLVPWKGGGVCANNSAGNIFQVNWGRENKLDNLDAMEASWRARFGPSAQDQPPVLKPWKRVAWASGIV
jgi:hypothetical protein